jgi:O-antigen/teichoic acid export membrane protein
MRMVIDIGDSHRFDEYFGVRLFLNIISIIVIFCIVLWGGRDVQLVWITLLVAVYHGLFMLSTLAQGVFQKHECMNYLGLSRILQGLTQIVSMAVGISVTGSLFGGLVALCLITLLKFLWYDLGNVKRFAALAPRFDFPLLAQVFRKCWVMSISAGMVSFSGNLPRYLVKSQMDTESLGFFTGISTTTMGMSLVAVALMATSLRRIAVFYDQDIHRFVNLLLKLAAIAVGFGTLNLLFTIVAGRWFLTLFFDSTYTAHLSAMYLYAGAGILLALISILGDTILSTHHYWWRIIASSGSVVTIFLAGCWLIPGQGLNGVAEACFLGFGVEFLICMAGLYVVSKRHRTISPSNAA